MNSQPRRATINGLAHDAPRTAKRFLQRHSGVVGSVTEVRTVSPEFVLTYDDGPEPGGTDRILTALAAHGASATFFVLLSRARRYRSLLSDVAAEGHEIALHGLDHRALTEFSAAEVWRRTTDGKRELEDLSGQPVRWLRPPYGQQTLLTWRASRRAGVEPVLWGPSTCDALDLTQAQRVDRAVSGAHAGTILLAHDGFAGPLDGVDDGPEPRLDRGELTNGVLAAYRDRGLVGRSLGSALEAGTIVRTAWFAR
jgi:peptidoglycan/xylan/chitin deacetylase (PgdA/CDA1 family)